MSAAPKVKKADVTRGRILDAAIELFAERSFSEVSISDIARVVGIAPQGVYRYFRDKHDLYLAALSTDIDSLHADLASQLSKIPLPSITGMLWRTYSSLVPAHPLAKKAICARDVDALRLLATLASTRNLLTELAEETVLGQKHGLYRQDIDILAQAESMEYFITHLQLPLIWDEKYATKEWIDANQVIVNALFYPAPDFSSEEVLKEYEAKIKEIVASL